ncbi:Hypothetical protein PSF113_5728 [Pseudomonas ogarae]|nr:Hypothetical protein PSF113_5728 [Pseudomonas ogarae]
MEECHFDLGFFPAAFRYGKAGTQFCHLVSREEFDSQMVVLALTRARLESLEAKVAELEARLAPAQQ